MTALLTAEELRDIEERARKATAGPWEARKGGYGAAPGDWRIDGVFTLAAVIDDVPELEEKAEATADFIAHARSDIPALLAHIKELTRERDEAVPYRDSAHIRADIADVKALLAGHKMPNYQTVEARAESAEAQVKELTNALATVLGDATHGQTETWTERCEIGRAALARHRSRTGREEEK